MAKVGFVGLGVMGAPMAGHLVAHGHEVTVWNRTPSKAEPLRQLGATVTADLSALAAVCEAVFLCVARDEDVSQCLDAMTPAASPGTLFVDHSTTSPGAALGFHQRLSEKGFRFLDAPVTGGSMGARAGTLTLFVGGSKADFEEVAPILQSYAKRAEHVGPGGAGQAMKMANQIAVGGALLGLCESLAFAQKAGLDLAQARELIGGGAGGSWAFDHYGPKILARDWAPGFSIAHQRKDFGYCTDMAQTINASIPGTLLVDRLLEVLEAQGHAGWTTAALYEVLLAKGFEP